MQLLLTVVIYLLKNFEHRTEHDLDSAYYGVCIHELFLNFTTVSVNTVKFSVNTVK